MVERQAPGHRKFLRDRRKLLRKIFHVELKSGEVPFDACEIKAFFADLVLFKMKNVAVMLINKIRERRIEASAVRALHEKDGAIFQNSSPALADILRNFGGETAVELTLFERSPILNVRMQGEFSPVWQSVTSGME